jgi:hypothetical protein
MSIKREYREYMKKKESKKEKKHPNLACYVYYGFRIAGYLFGFIIAIAIIKSMWVISNPDWFNPDILDADFLQLLRFVATTVGGTIGYGISIGTLINFLVNLYKWSKKNC